MMRSQKAAGWRRRRRRQRESARMLRRRMGWYRRRVGRGLGRRWGLRRRVRWRMWRIVGP